MEAAIAAKVIGTGLEIAGAIQEGNSAAAAARMQAKANRANARDERARSAEDERNFRVMARKDIGGMRANIGASGVAADGSAVDVLAESAANAEIDALNIRKDGERRAQGYERGARLDEHRARSARTSGYLKAAGALFAGGADIGTMGSMSRTG